MHKVLYPLSTQYPYRLSVTEGTVKTLQAGAAVYLNNVTTPYWWRDNCEPYQSGANNGKPQQIKTHPQAVQHIELYCGGKSESLKSIIRSMAIAKGLAVRAGDKKVQELFS